MGMVWCSFSKEKQISGLPKLPTVTRRDSNLTDPSYEGQGLGYPHNIVPPRPTTKRLTLRCL